MEYKRNINGRYTFISSGFYASGDYISPVYIASDLTYYLNAYYSDIYSFSYSEADIYGVLKDSRQVTGFYKDIVEW